MTKAMNIIQDMQEKVAEYAIAEAKAKKEKAEVELETAKFTQEYVRKLAEANPNNMKVVM